MGTYSATLPMPITYRRESLKWKAVQSCNIQFGGGHLSFASALPLKVTAHLPFPLSESKSSQMFLRRTEFGPRVFCS